MSSLHMRSILLRDIIDALGSHELWIYLAWQDIRLRYRRSKIGPFWITLSMTIFIVVLGVVYSKLFKADIKEYLPFLSAGFVVWTYMSGMLGEFPNMFVESAPYIKESKTNPLVILCRTVMRHAIILAHNGIIMLCIYVYFKINPGLVGLLVFPGIVLVMLNLSAIGVVLSLIGARFRDVAPITQNMIQVIFFVTPLMWFPRLVPEDSWIILANPFAYYLDLTRSPLLGVLPDTRSWVVALVTLLAFSLIAATLYKSRAHRIPFWV